MVERLIRKQQVLQIARHESASRRPLGLAELRGWRLLVVGVAYWGNVVRTTRAPDATGLAAVAESVLAHGAFCAAAWVMVALVRESRPAGVASGRQFIASVAICLLCAVPTRQATIAALVACGLQEIWPGGIDSRRAVAALLFWLAIELAWTSTYLLPMHAVVANLDAVIVRSMLGLAGIGAVAHSNVIENVGSGFGIEVLAPCASSFPLASIALAFVVTTLYQGRRPCLRDLPWLAASLLASAVLTELRLACLASRELDFVWLHDGGGATVYTLAAVSLAVMFPLFATRALPRARRIP